VLEAVELGALVVEVGLDGGLAALEAPDPRLKSADPRVVGADLAREDALGALALSDPPLGRLDLLLDVVQLAPRRAVRSRGQGSPQGERQRDRRDQDPEPHRRRAMLATCAAGFGKIAAMPRPTSFGRDTGLQVRMVVTMFLLGLVYVVLVAVAVTAQ